MSEMRLSDVQLDRDLRAIVPSTAPFDLGARIHDEIEATAQVRAVPMPLALLTDADPTGRRRTWLLLAAALLAIGLAAAGLAGALLRDTSRPPIPEVSLEAPEDLAEFVSGAYARMPELPAMTISVLEDGPEGPIKHRVLVSDIGAVRVETFATLDATEPETYKVYSGTTIGELLLQDGRPAWYAGSGISEDPRVFVYATMGRGIFGVPLAGCEVATSEGELYADTPGRGWTWVGVEDVLGRPTHHVRCEDRELWLDIETSLALRSRGTAMGDDFQAIPGETRTVEATELTFGSPPDDLFALQPPPGVATLDDETYSCMSDPYCQASPKPVVTPPPAAGEPALADSADAVIARALEAIADPPAFDALVVGWDARYPGTSTRVIHDGDGRWRREYASQGSDPPWVVIIADGRRYASEQMTDGTPYWSDRPFDPRTGRDSYPLWIQDTCDRRWQIPGVDDVHGRPADHLTCAGDPVTADFWIDRETGLVLRTQVVDTTSPGTASVEEVTSLTIGPQPPELFQVPPDVDLRTDTPSSPPG